MSRDSCLRHTPLSLTENGSCKSVLLESSALGDSRAKAWQAQGHSFAGGFGHASAANKHPFLETHSIPSLLEPYPPKGGLCVPKLVDKVILGETDVDFMSM